MHILSLIAGFLCIFIVLLDAFQTIILPRRATGKLRLTRLFIIGTWVQWRWMAKKIRNRRRRDAFLSYYGPLSLLLLVIVWATGLVVGYALLFYGLHTPFTDPHAANRLETDLYVSGTTLFTLGLGDVVPHVQWARLLIVLEAGTGLGFVAGMIGYLPVLYGAFSRREVTIVLLDARAGSPPTAVELLRRHAGEAGSSALQTLLVEWERWAAELLESHISYPLLCYFRSQHDNQSWLSALVAILDACALMIATMQAQSTRQAQLTFAMARHAVLDLEQIFLPSPQPIVSNRLPEERVEYICQILSEAGFTLCGAADSIVRLRELCAMYEPQAERLSRLLMLPLPAFYPDANKRNSWSTVEKLRMQTEASLGRSSQDGGAAAHHAIAEDAHLF
ncbi:MAG TPA: potassium channel family protein [Acidobacteriaceae bacterium]|nr:potassium channel family protein [Acidobacteriaceae bacterium]